MDIASVMAQIAAIQGALTISSPEAMTVQKVWTYPPPLSRAIPAKDTPAFVNEWTFDHEERTTNGLRQQYYTVHMQFLQDAEADYDNACLIASNFMAALVNGFDATETINGTAFWSKLRGATPTLSPMMRNGLLYAGLDLFLDVTLTEGKMYGA